MHHSSLVTDSTGNPYERVHDPGSHKDVPGVEPRRELCVHPPCTRTSFGRVQTAQSLELMPNAFELGECDQTGKFGLVEAAYRI